MKSEKRALQSEKKNIRTLVVVGDAMLICKKEEKKNDVFVLRTYDVI